MIGRLQIRIALLLAAISIGRKAFRKLTVYEDHFGIKPGDQIEFRIIVNFTGPPGGKPRFELDNAPEQEPLPQAV